MKPKIACVLIMFLSSVGTAVLAGAPERVLWDKRPIKVHIQQGQERIIHFPDEVRYWLPDSIKQKVSVLAANGVLYIRALEPFISTRVRIQSLSDQQIYLLDVTANDIGSVSETLIVMTQKSVSNLSKDVEDKTTVENWRVRLTRYAARQLYAPERLAGSDKAIKRIPLTVTSPLPLIRGGVLEAIPIASWQATGLTVTAVKLRNTSAKRYHIGFKPSDSSSVLSLNQLIRGDWLTATVQHNFVGPSDHEDDTTTLYLVSDRPFVESLNGLTPSRVGTGEITDG